MIHTLTHTLTDPAYVLSTILVCALCTQITRWLPFLLFGGKKEVPRLVRYLGTILPAAIMAVLPEGNHSPGISLRTARTYLRGRGGGAPSLEGKYTGKHCPGHGLLYGAGADGILIVF